MTVEDLTPTIVRKFLNHVEYVRGCSGVTRNHRLATVHSLAKFIGMRSPLHIAWATEIRSIPFKKTANNVIGYLERAEMDALLKAPDRRTALGDRDHAVLLFLYNSGARADEAAGLLIGNLHLKGSPAVRMMGKECHSYCISLRPRHEITGTHACRPACNLAFSLADVLLAVRKGIGLGPCTDAHEAGRVEPMSEPYPA
jgi:site-specific recombinase XerD